MYKALTTGTESCKVYKEVKGLLASFAISLFRVAFDKHNSDKVISLSSCHVVVVQTAVLNKLH